MNDDATLVPTSNTHISRRSNQRLKQSKRPLFDTDNTNTPADLTIPNNVQEIETNRDIELELDGPYLNESFEANYRSPKETDFILAKSLADLIEYPVLLHKHLPKQTDIESGFRTNQRESFKKHPFTRIY